MGVVTEGQMWVSFGRPLTYEETSELVANCRALTKDEDHECSNWEVNGQSWGDIGKLDIDEHGMDFSCYGKVGYDIEKAVGAFVAFIPESAKAEGEGFFETEGEHFAIRVDGQTTYMAYASLVAGDWKVVE